MANSTTANPWILDTAAVITTDWVSIESVRWVDATTADHSCTVEDAAGRVYIDLEATGDDYTEDKAFGDGPVSGRFKGFELAVIDSGKLYVYLR